TIQSNGSILIDDYRGGTATGAVVIGNGVTLTARGGGTIGGVTAEGTIGIHSSTAGDITIGTGLTATAWGGNVWLNAGNDLNMGAGFNIDAIAKLDDGGGTIFIPAAGQSVPAYIGGGVGIYAGRPTFN